MKKLKIITAFLLCFLMVCSTLTCSFAQPKTAASEGTSANVSIFSDEHLCSCGDNAPANLAHHADSCVRKQFVKTLFEGKTVEAVYENWKACDEALQEDLLNMVEIWWSAADFAKLKALINGGGIDNVDDVIEKLKSAKGQNEYDKIFDSLSEVVKSQITAEQLEELEALRENLPAFFESNDTEYNGVPVVVDVAGDIPASADVSVKPVIGEDLANVGFTFDEHDHILTALDVTIYDKNGNEWQPEAGNSITVSFDVSDFGPEDGDICTVYHKHADEEPIVSEHEVENGYINYRTDKLSVMVIADDYPLYPTKYDSSKLLYWDVAEKFSNGFPTHRQGDASRVASVKLNGTTVARGNSAGRSPSQWKVAGQNAESLSEYFPGTSIGSENNTKELTITPAAGYYVTGVTVACTAYQPEKWQGLVVMHDAYNCGTWKSGNEYSKSLSYESTGAVTVEIPSMAFCHMSNGLDIFKDTGGLVPERGGTNEYFILIEVAPVPSPLYVEYQYGDIVSKITNNTQKAVFTGSAQWVTEAVDKNGNSLNGGQYTKDTANTQYKYYYGAGLSQSQQAAEAAKWKHTAGGISEAAAAAARSAGYEFAGWEATYHTSCTSTKLSAPNPNNYSYGFGTQLGSAANYTKDASVPLHTHVKMVAKWKKLETYSLTVRKTVNDPNNYENGNLSYNLYLTVDGKLYSGTAKLNGSTAKTISNGKLTLKDGQYYVIEGLYKGTTYSVSEKISETSPPAGYSYKEPTYKVGTNEATTTAPSNKTLNGNTTVVVTNELEVIPRTLTIKKTVVDPDNVGNGNTAYPVTLTVNGSAYSGTAKLNGTTNVTVSNGKITLKDGEWYVIEGLKDRDKYSVAESLSGVNAPTGYEYKAPVYKIGTASSTTTAPSNKTLDSDVEVLITNELKAIPYKLTINKTVIDPDNVEDGTISYPVTVTVNGSPYTGVAKLNGESSIEITDGKISLKDGEYYVIEGLKYGTKYSVKENITGVTAPTGYRYKTPTYKVGTNAATATAPDNKTLSGNTTVAVTNELEAIPYKLTINKTVIDPGNIENGTTEYPVKVTINSSPYSGKAKLNGETEVTINNGNLTIKDGDSYVIEGLKYGNTYSVVEDISSVDDPKGYEYIAPAYKIGNSDAEAEVSNKTLIGDTSVLITNELKAVYGDIRITKDGINKVDNHIYKDPFRLEENQSTTYRIKGVENDIDMEVVIVGNTSVLIKALPVGEYIVTENEAWSWRYDAVEVSQEATVTGGGTATVPFINVRNELFWLSGDNYMTNWWGGSNGTKLVQRTTPVN